ncbi:MAG TPA: glycogen synthase [Ferruginibacter sp.]|nr:glycogen synthase [Ferruginibacter sp.]HRO07075.1 glycogen synthase [Ferruginibacter sp.]HRO96378.1 glycogen synthase [Ferruginibacter sp.]HRP48483.1 glycogen synthase [Ferruginibacter sp.]
MEIIHVSAECYPVAKTGGLGDVVGALPKYQQQQGHVCKVVMPMHRKTFLYENEWEVVHKSHFKMGKDLFECTIIKEVRNVLGFDLYCVEVPGLLDRENIYGYEDDTFRYLCFQVAVLEWMNAWSHVPDVVHVHDHHSALIPFMMQHCYAYTKLQHIKTLLTIHNAEYQGWMEWKYAGLLPAWDTWKWGLLDWDNLVNPLACGIKCARYVTTVSPGYLQEIMLQSKGLESLLRNEAAKCSGIINGVDYTVWNPETDTYILDNFGMKDVKAGKELNKQKLCKDFNLNPQLPLIVFIGRLVHEKAADLLVPAIQQAFDIPNCTFNFLVLGSGDPAVEQQLTAMNEPHAGYYNSRIAYNEKLSHLMYAGADFLMMPSRVEPCGLNQLYAMRYGTVPMVRKTGGLKDTVIDYEDEGGYGITFEQATTDDMVHAMQRALILYGNKTKLQELRKRMMKINNSWEARAQDYLKLYQN